MGIIARETSHKRLLNEKTADGPCTSVLLGEVTQEERGKVMERHSSGGLGERPHLRPGLSSASGRYEQGRREAPGPGS